MTFQVVTEGSCWLELQGQDPRQLRPGNLILIPHGTPYRLTSAPHARAEPLFDIPVEHVSERYEIMRYGGGGAPTQITCGVVRFDQVAAERLINALPEVLWLDAWSTGDGGLHSLLQLITREATTLRPGGETVITRLADVIIIQAIRAWLDSAPEAQRGWFSALRDPQIGSSLAAIHRAPQRLDRRRAGSRGGHVTLGVLRAFHRARRQSTRSLFDRVAPTASTTRAPKIIGAIGSFGFALWLPIGGRLFPRLQPRVRSCSGQLSAPAPLARLSCQRSGGDVCIVCLSIDSPFVADDASATSPPRIVRLCAKSNRERRPFVHGVEESTAVHN